MTRRSWAFDVALAAAVGTVGQLEAWTGFASTHRQGPLWVQALLYAVTALLLVGRRWRPLAVLIAIVAVSLVEFASVGSPAGYGVSLAPVIATYTVAHQLPWRSSRWALGLVALFHVGWASLDRTNQGLVEVATSFIWLAPALIAWLLGALLRARRLSIEQRQANREQRALQAVAEERTRIARELHDVIGHSVSVMTVQTSAVRRRLDPSQVVEREALETVEAVGREALSEMRRMVGVLRQDGDAGGLAPPPGLAQVDRLVEKFRVAGLPVVLSVTGAARDLAPGLDLTAYRLVQEGLTNTLRHVREPRGAHVSIDYGADAIVLAVRDDGGPGVPLHDSDAMGNGLLGLRERVAVNGGSLVARPRPEGGFELVATLPVEPVPARPVEVP